MVVKVAVIGAGATGLCSLRHLTARPEVFQAVCFDKNLYPGGSWIYREESGTDNNGELIESSMYQNLRTNIPKEIMAFPDFPFKENLPSFIGHKDVKEYLESYALNFDLLKYIKFHTTVNYVEPVKTNRGTEWRVTYSSIAKLHDVKQEIFDAVMVCNGHFFEPMMPRIAGYEKFEGEIIHSHEYRRPEVYTGKRVVCLGAGQSGQDIAVDISSTASTVYLSHKKELKDYVPEYIIQKPGINRFTESGVVFEGNDEVEVDTVVMCTGYLYSFPFLSDACNVQITDKRVTPLYKHLIHTEFTTLSFIGLLKSICPFPNFNCQVLFVLAALDGSMALPSKAEMDEDTEKDFQERMESGLPKRHSHVMNSRQWSYNNTLADLAGFDPVPKYVELLYKELDRKRVINLVEYRNVNYTITGMDSFEIKE